MNPYVFIVGCPRSGTTLLQRMINAHPQIAITPETHWIPQMLKKRRGVIDGMVTPELIPLLLRKPRFADLNIGKEQLESLKEGWPVSYSDFVTRVFDLYGQAHGKPLVGDKTPGYVVRINTLHELWPAARFVHLIRDGRDVCLSLRSWSKAEKNLGTWPTWRDNAVSTAALYWEFHVQCGQQAGRWLGPKLYYEVRYESLVVHPEEECAALCDFLGVPYDDVMLRFHEGRTITDPTLSAKHAWLPVTPGLRNWRTQMAAEDVERFEAEAGQLLDELEYARAIAHPRPESAEHATRIRELLAQDPKWIARFGSVVTEGRRGDGT